MNADKGTAPPITRQAVAHYLLDYLNSKNSLAELVDWAEQAIKDGDISETDTKMVMQILGRIAAADVKEFGLLWQDCEQIMSQLGYSVRVDLEQAA